MGGDGECRPGGGRRERKVGDLDCARPRAGGIGVQPQHQLRLPRHDKPSDAIAEGRAVADARGPVWARGRRGQRYLTAFFSPAPAVNFGTREAPMWIRSPVAGLRPSRALRLDTLNLPKPEKETSLPRLSAPSSVSRKASTASVASFLLNPARSAT